MMVFIMPFLQILYQTKYILSASSHIVPVLQLAVMCLNRCDIDQCDKTQFWLQTSLEIS